MKDEEDHFEPQNEVATTNEGDQSAQNEDGEAQNAEAQIRKYTF